MGRHDKILGCRPSSNTTECIIDRTMAGAEPATVVAARVSGLLSERYASEVGADSDDN